MKTNRILLIAAVISVIVVIIITMMLVPQATNPAYDTALVFIHAASTGDDATAFPLLNQEMQAWVSTNCPDGSVSACVRGYELPEWQGFRSAVFRRAAPDGAAWDVTLIASYNVDPGGVCIYHRMEQEAGAWRVAGWAGFIKCAQAESTDMANNPLTPNRAP